MLNKNLFKHIKSIPTTSNLCQIKNKKLSYKLINKKLRCRPSRYLSTYSDATRQALDALLWVSHRYGIIYMSQEELAKIAGISIKSFIEATKILEADGLLAKVYRHRHTCVYRLSDFFKNTSVKEDLVGFFKRSIILPVSLLLSIFPKTCLSEYYRPLEREKKYLLRNNIHYFQKENVDVKKKKRFRTLRESLKMKDEIFNEIAKIRRMKLTRRGIVELTKYDPRAIAHANQQLELCSSNVRNPFLWFCKIANQISAANDWPMGYAIYNRLMKSPEIKKDDKMLITTTLSPMHAERKPRPNEGMYAVYKHKERDIDPDDEKQRFIERKTINKLTPEAEKWLERADIKW